MLALLFFIALPFLFLGARKKLRAARASADWPSVVGVITASAAGRRRMRQQPQVAYTYGVNGQPFAGTNIPYSGAVPAADTAAYLARYPVGQAVNVFHSPTNPAEAVLVPGPDRLLEKQPMVLTGWLVALLLLNGIRFLQVVNDSAEEAKRPRIRTYAEIVAQREPTVADDDGRERLQRQGAATVPQKDAKVLPSATPAAETASERRKTRMVGSGD